MGILDIGPIFGVGSRGPIDVPGTPFNGPIFTRYTEEKLDQGSDPLNPGSDGEGRLGLGRGGKGGRGGRLPDVEESESDEQREQNRFPWISDKYERDRARGGQSMGGGGLGGAASQVGATSLSYSGTGGYQNPPPVFSSNPEHRPEDEDEVALIRDAIEQILEEFELIDQVPGLRDCIEDLLRNAEIRVVDESSLLFQNDEGRITQGRADPLSRSLTLARPMDPARLPATILHEWLHLCGASEFEACFLTRMIASHELGIDDWSIPDSENRRRRVRDMIRAGTLRPVIGDDCLWEGEYIFFDCKTGEVWVKDPSVPGGSRPEGQWKELQALFYGTPCCRDTPVPPKGDWWTNRPPTRDWRGRIVR